MRVFKRISLLVYLGKRKCCAIALCPPWGDCAKPSAKGDRLGDLGIPVVSGLPFGHDGPNAALPVGVKVTLDAEQGILNIMQ